MPRSSFIPTKGIDADESPQPNGEDTKNEKSDLGIVTVSERASLDPLAMMRSAVDQWEKLANEYGGQFLQRPETTLAMQKMTAGFLQMQKMTQDAMGKALAASNLPSRVDIEALSSRLGSIEASLVRIEAATGGAGPPTVAPLPRPPRTRKPPPRP